MGIGSSTSYPRSVYMFVLHRAHGCTEFAENYQVQLRPCHLAAVAPKVKDVVESEALEAQTTFVSYFLWSSITISHPVKLCLLDAVVAIVQELQQSAYLQVELPHCCPLGRSVCLFPHISGLLLIQAPEPFVTVCALCLC